MGAVAGQNSSFQIRNPVGSGVVGVIEQISCWSTVTAQEVRLTKQAATAAQDLTLLVAGNQGAADNRGKQQPAIIASFGAQVGSAGLGTILHTHGISSAQLDVEFIITDFQELPILPGDAYRVTLSNLNIALNGFFRWRERGLEDAEKF